MNKLWVDVDIRDEIVTYIDYILNKAGFPKQIKLKWILKMIGINLVLSYSTFARCYLINESFL